MSSWFDTSEEELSSSSISIRFSLTVLPGFDLNLYKNSNSLTFLRSWLSGEQLLDDYSLALLESKLLLSSFLLNSELEEYDGISGTFFRCDGCLRFFIFVRKLESIDDIKCELGEESVGFFFCDLKKN